MQNFTTPMMKQYVKIKKNYQDCLLFFRMGDFYELFMEDAHIGAKVLNITLTSRPKGRDGRIPMAGVPYHAGDSYLAKLVKAGYKVAICEQMSLPNKYGIVDREVIRIVTPGTILDENALNKKENNYITAITVEGKRLGLAIADVSTGFFSSTEIEFVNLSEVIKDELSRVNPSECILPENLYNNPVFLRLFKINKEPNIYCFKEWEEYAKRAKDFLKKHFGLKTLLSFAIEDKPLALQTSAALLAYLKQTQKATVSHIKKIITYERDEHLVIDRSTMINLELFSTIREHDVRGSLLSVLDQTQTAMGGRMLKQWLCKPLTKKEKIIERYEAVEKLLKLPEERTKINDYLKQIIDIERILSRMSVNLGNARDLINLKHALRIILLLKKDIQKIKSSLIKKISQKISDDLNQTITEIEKYIADEPPIDLRSGGLLKSGVNSELDNLRKKVESSKEWILELELKERERTGISSLKVRFNKVFGFFIEISRANLHLVPKDYLRKQTLVNGERFITPDLKKHEEIILTAEEKINDLEYKIFLEVLERILKHTTIIQEAAQSLASLDCLLNFSYLTQKEGYVKPKIVESGEIIIKGGRHPVVEKLLEDSQFVPNDLKLNNDQQLLLITGPNMAGKSVFIRQVALIVLLAQIGCFVPAEEATISLVDRIFVRSGASDVITSGLSTFMVEMVETAHILHHATKNSLIILDEIGRGTSTYDGISIAWAVAEYLVTYSKIPPKILFATHYHELQVLEKNHPGKIKNYHMSVAEKDGEPIFLYTLSPGGASHSFGVAVAKLAGIPAEVIEKAKVILQKLEKRHLEKPKETEIFEPTIINLIEHVIHQELEKIDIHEITPLEALNKLAAMKDKLKLLKTDNEKNSSIIS
ncbi:MAG: DNA mismatch repair protein MutS [Candidatus Roizmanbacteria bacterium]|nr:MAG: DNA mismatch repair protein MutS [Candidatus Roizmanbacteria bacterium]